MSFERVWLSPEAKKKAKAKAAEQGLSLADYLDTLLLGGKKGGGFDKFF
jgi:hypothetical protein